MRTECWRGWGRRGEITRVERDRSGVFRQPHLRGSSYPTAAKAGSPPSQTETLGDDTESPSLTSAFPQSLRKCVRKLRHDKQPMHDSDSL